MPIGTTAVETARTEAGTATATTASASTGTGITAVLDGADATMIARAVPHGLIAAGGGVGFRVPAHRSALGRVLLAHRDTQEDATSTTPPPGGTVLDSKVAAGIREEGYCYVANEVQAGFHSVAVPIRRWDGRVIAAMNVGCPLEQIPREEMTGTVLGTLQEHAECLRAQLV
ncbi:IclR family transcriptional regulator domain-containing protein [Streptomyces sp. NPDC001156]